MKENYYKRIEPADAYVLQKTFREPPQSSGKTKLENDSKKDSKLKSGNYENARSTDDTSGEPGEGPSLEEYMARLETDPKDEKQPESMES